MTDFTSSHLLFMSSIYRDFPKNLILVHFCYCRVVSLPSSVICSQMAILFMLVTDDNNEIKEWQKMFYKVGLKLSTEYIKG